MRILLAIVVLAGLGWSGFWLFNATMRDRALTGWLEERRTAGWMAEAEDIRVTGFPNRVDTIVTGLALADPRAGWSWQAPEFQILSQTYRPHRMIAVWDGEQQISTPVETLRINADQLIGSLGFEPNTRLALDHSTIEAQNLRIAGDSGWTATIGDGLFSTRQSPSAPAPFSYDIDLSLKSLTLPDGVVQSINRAGVLPQAIESTSLAATLTFDRAWDRVAIETDNPALRAISIADLAFTWGDVGLRGSGDLTVDPMGFAAGRIDLVATNWRRMLDAAEQSGLVSSTISQTLRGALGLYARFSGDGDSLSLPLEFIEGRAMLGPVPIGAAPLLARADP